MSDKKKDQDNVTPLPKSTHSGFFKDSDGSFGIRFDLEDLVEEAEEQVAEEVEEKRLKAVPDPDENDA